MTQNRRRRSEIARRYTDAAAKVDDAATRSDVAALSTFSPIDGDDSTPLDRNGAVGSLTGELVYLGYSFVEVRGEYVGPGHMKPVHETTVLVTQPFPSPSPTFQRDLQNLARKHGVDVTLAWDHENRVTIPIDSCGPLDPNSNDGSSTFTVDGARATAWRAYGSEHPNSRYRDRHSVLTEVSEGVGDVAAGTKLIRFATRRKEIFGEAY